MENKAIEHKLRDIDKSVELGLITSEMADKLKMDAFNSPRHGEPQGSDSVAAAFAALAEANRRERNREEWMDHKDRSVFLWKSLGGHGEIRDPYGRLQGGVSSPRSLRTSFPRGGDGVVHSSSKRLV